MYLRSLDAADATHIAGLWLTGAAESGKTEAAYLPQVSQQAYAATLAGDLASEACIGWGIFDAATASLLAYLTAKIATPEAEFKQVPYLYLLDLDVHPQQRRRGLGAKLIAAARAYAETQKLGSIEVNWLSEDAQASAFWLSQDLDNFWYVDAIACPETASTAQNVTGRVFAKQKQSRKQCTAQHPKQMQRKKSPHISGLFANDDQAAISSPSPSGWHYRQLLSC
jgi:ribosomal protein S18 acetylase RimI-like enzyme